MSVTTNQPRGLNLPRPKPPIVPVTQENVRDWWALFVNRKAYTRQSANPHPETGRHYHYQPKNKDSGQPLELDPATVRKHLAGWITVGLYAINSQSQRCKWIAIDADYDDAFFDLGKLKGELELDGVSAALEMSRRGGHLWIFCEQPLLAEQCRVYIYNVALRLGVPIKGAAGLRDGIEIFPRQDRLAPGEFGNALRGPLGVHRANNHRYWFYDAGSDINSQLALPQEPEEAHRSRADAAQPGHDHPGRVSSQTNRDRIAAAQLRSQPQTVLDPRLRPETTAQGERELLHPVSVLCAGGQ